MKRGSRALIALFAAALAIVLISIYLSKHTSEQVVSTSALEISEVMSSNKGSVADPNGDYPDWIEFHNTSKEELDIGGLGASDDVTAGVKYVFPAGTRVAADGYIVLWCSGEATDQSHAPFRISAADSVVLFGASGNTLETLVLKAVDSGLSYAKDSAGAWAAMKPSPGYPNDEAGIAAYEATLMSQIDAGVYINEFMASNSTTIMDAYGAYADWVEIYNATDKDYDLSGGGLSDTLTQPKKYVFPEGTVVPAGGYLLIFCSGNAGFAENGELHAPLGLRAYGEDVVLTAKNGAILDSVSYPAQETDSSFARVPDGTGAFGFNTHPTPGYPNDEEGYSAFMAANALPRGALSLSEIMGANISVKAAADGNCYDLIELHNAGAEPVSLLGYALSNNPNNPGKWLFPDVSIPAGGYLTVYASELDKYENNELHANFAVSRDGDTVCLFSPEGMMLDKLQSGAFLNDVSYGRDDAGKLAYFAKSTFGAANGKGYAGVTAIPSFSTAPGIYAGTIQIELSAPEGEAIHYTLDCTTPAASSPVYTGPIAASENTVVRAVSIREGYITNATTSGTFLFQSDGVNHSLPVVALVTDPDNLWSSEKGIYAYGDNYNPDLEFGDMLATAQFYTSKSHPELWERPAGLEVFDESGSRVFFQNVGIRIAGSFGRGRAQKGFNVFARDQYGRDRMEYPFFEDLPFSEYKAVVLRAGGQDQSYSKIRDELATGLLQGMDVNVLTQAYKPYVLYLNGEYWGVYFMKEKRNRFFVAQHEGTENATDLNIIKSEDTAFYGSTQEWRDLMSYVRSHDLNDGAAYAYVDERVDLSSFTDYMICEIYAANSDVWNIQYYKLPGGKWKWIYYDFCWSFGSSGTSTTHITHPTLSIRRLSSKPCSDLFNKLLAVPEWRDAFCRRFAELLKTVYAPERVNAYIDTLYGYVEPEMAREREKFNSATWLGIKQPAINISDYKEFQDQIALVRKFANERPDAIKAQLQAEFGLTDSYMREVFG